MATGDYVGLTVTLLLTGFMGWLSNTFYHLLQSGGYTIAIILAVAFAVFFGLLGLVFAAVGSAILSIKLPESGKSKNFVAIITALYLISAVVLFILGFSLYGNSTLTNIFSIPTLTNIFTIRNIFTVIFVIGCIAILVKTIIKFPPKYRILGAVICGTICILICVFSLNFSPSSESNVLKDEDGRVYAQCRLCNTKYYRDAYDDENYKSIFNSNMCKRCYDNYKAVKDAFDHYELNN